MNSMQSSREELRGQGEDGLRSIQPGEWPSWIRFGSSSAIRRTRQVQFGEWPSWISAGSGSAVRRTVLVQLGEWRSWIRLGSSSANGRAESLLGPARRTAELNPCWVQLGRSQNWTGPARRTAELSPCWVQLGERLLNPCSMIKFVCFDELIL